MQVIIPVAGKGSRMRPHTHTTPKPLIHVAGKPAIDYILDELKELGNVSKIIFITGHLKDQFEEHARENYDFDMEFIEQKVLDGTSGAINLARPHIDEDVLVIFADTVFDVDLNTIKECSYDGIIWGKKVEDYSRFGIMLTDDDDCLTEMKEKPDKPYTRLANIGMYYVKNYKVMYDCIDEQYEKDLKHKGEYNFPEALGMMADRGQKLKILEVDGWYDTGKPETVLASQKILLEKRHKTGGEMKNCEIKEPVYIEDGAVIEGSVIGPNVSIAKGARIKGSVIRDSIIGMGSEVIDSSLHESIVGYEAWVEGVSGQVNVGDHSEVIIGDHEDNS